MEVIKSYFPNIVLAAEEEKTAPFHMCTWAVHNAYEIYILEEGVRKLYIGNQSYQTEACDAAMIPANTLHRSEGAAAYKGICIHFTREGLDGYFTKKAQEELLDCFLCPVISLTGKGLEEVKTYFMHIQKKETNPYFHLAGLLALLNRQKKQMDIGKKESCTAAFENITSYIDRNYSAIRCLDDIAAPFHVTKEYLCRLFKRQTGITVVTYLNSIRIQKACRLLGETDKTVEAVSAACGFQSPIYFSRLFKQMMNHTPGQYRRLMRNGLRGVRTYEGPNET